LRFQKAGLLVLFFKNTLKIFSKIKLPGLFLHINFCGLQQRGLQGLKMLMSPSNTKVSTYILVCVAVQSGGAETFGRRVKVKLALCVTKYAQGQEGVWGRGCTETAEARGRYQAQRQQSLSTGNDHICTKFHIETV
jgi:hypothetical protein